MGYRRRLSGYLLLFVAAAAAGLFGTSFAAHDAPARSGRRVIHVTARKFAYEPAEITLAAHKPVLLEIVAIDGLHGFAVPDLGIRADLLAGQVVRLEFTPERVGTFPFHCDNFCGAGHEEMAGTIRVTAVADARTPDPGQAIAPAAPEPTSPPPATLARLQQAVFGPRCAVCHSGGGNALPTVLDLSSAAASRRSLIGARSVEDPALARVEAGLPERSLLVQKLEAAGPGSAARMPFGGPYLTPAEIAEVRQWITEGASDGR